MGRKTKQNKLTSPETIAQINPKNIRLMNDFLEYLRSIGKADSTIKAYTSDLHIFFVWVLQNADNKYFPEISKRDIVAYQNWLLKNNENSPARVRRLKSTLSSLSNYIEAILDDELPNFRSIVKKIENPAMQHVRQKTVWTDEALDNLLRQLSEKGQHKRACIVALGICSGRRKAELCRFRVDDFKDENLVCGGALYKTSAPMRTKGAGTGKYIYCYTLAKRFKPYYDAWMMQRKELGIESEWLFPDKVDQTQQMNDATLSVWAEIFSKMTGENFYFHSLRHAFVTGLVRAGLPDSVITKIVGWESVDMCQVYTDIEAEEQIGMFFDEDGNIRAGKKDLSDM